jgi:hypothetical protein
MRFKSDKHAILYGYEFKPGVVVEVKEKNLIRKFKTYPFLQVVRGRPSGSVRTKKQSVEKDQGPAERTDG